MKSITAVVIILFLIIGAMAKEVDSSTIIYDGIASWYSEDDPGVLETTANMEQFDDTKLTCAIWGISFNTILKVTNLKNGRFVFVRVNDRGPAKRFVRRGRIIDLTKAAFLKIANLKEGLVHVSIEVMS